MEDFARRIVRFELITDRHEAWRGATASLRQQSYLLMYDVMQYWNDCVCWKL